MDTEIYRSLAVSQIAWGETDSYLVTFTRIVKSAVLLKTKTEEAGCSHDTRTWLEEREVRGGNGRSFLP